MKIIDHFNKFAAICLDENAPIFFFTKTTNFANSTTEPFAVIRGDRHDLLWMLREAFKSEVLADLVREALPPIPQMEILIEPAEEDDLQ